MSRSRWSSALALCVGCASSPPVPAPTPKVAPSTGHAAPPAPVPRDASNAAEQALQDRLGEALRYVARVRGLAPKNQVRGRLISRSEIERYVSDQLDQETPKDVVEATEALLYGFGTVDASFDYRASVISLMSSQLLGFYDPQKKAFFVAGQLRGEEADVTLWHELVHALQDQYFDLSRILDWQPDGGDRQAAVHALAEGDATSAMLDAMLEPRGVTALQLPDGLMRAESVLGSAALTAPPVLVRSLLAPYADGLAFTNYLRRKGGFAAVDEAWRSLPVSTEQLLHPEKFLAHEPPLEVALPAAPAHLPGFTERFHDVMGEQTLRILLEEWLPARTAAEAAADWGGDRLSVFSDAEHARWAGAWHLRFDSDAAATRCLTAFIRAAALTDRSAPSRALAPPASVASPGPSCHERAQQGPIALARHGRDLAITLGPFQRHIHEVAEHPGCSAALAWARSLATL